MQHAIRLGLVSALLMPAFGAGANPFAGRWDFNVPTPNGMRASWLGVTDKGGAAEIWFQPTGGNVYQVKDFQLTGSRLKLNLSPASANRPALTWDLKAEGDKLTGTQTRGEATTALTGVRAPELKRSAPKAWARPEPLFNSKNRTGGNRSGIPPTATGL